MLPGAGAGSRAASGTISDPTPTSLPPVDIRAAPPKKRCGGLVKIAFSSRYSQYPANARRETVITGITAPGPPNDAITAGVPSTSASESPSAIGTTLSRGACARSSPKPVSWS